MPKPASDSSKPYVIGKLDVIEVDVWGAPNLSGVHDVGPDGTFQMPILGAVKADGLTETELNQLLRQKLVGPVFTEPPEVVVQVLRINSKKFYVYGAVGHQGEYPLNGDITVMDAIANFGGFTPFANKKKIRIVRGPDASGKVQTFKFNYEEVSHGKKFEQNIKLMPNDRIYVDE
jgi:polysaccharide export outer membrane protein